MFSKSLYFLVAKLIKLLNLHLIIKNTNFYQSCRHILRAYIL